MLFMQFKIGPDMGICLIKAILYALLSVFVLMPGLLVLFGPLIEETKHKNFVPKISFVGKIDYATRHVVPVIFVAVAVLGLYFSNRCPYAYGYSSLKTLKLNATQIADNMVADNFTSSNMVALIIPPGDYEKEAELQQIICNRQHGGKHRFHPDSSGGAAVHVQIRCHADIADTGHSGQHMDRFLNAVSNWNRAVLYELSGRKLHTDGRKYRLSGKLLCVRFAPWH